MVTTEAAQAALDSAPDSYSAETWYAVWLPGLIHSNSIVLCRARPKSLVEGREHQF